MPGVQKEYCLDISIVRNERITQQLEIHLSDMAGYFKICFTRPVILVKLLNSISFLLTSRKSNPQNPLIAVGFQWFQKATTKSWTCDGSHDAVTLLFNR